MDGRPRDQRVNQGSVDVANTITAASQTYLIEILKTTTAVPVISAWSGWRTHAESHYQRLIAAVMQNKAGVLILRVSKSLLSLCWQVLSSSAPVKEDIPK